MPIPELCSSVYPGASICMNVDPGIHLLELTFFSKLMSVAPINRPAAIRIIGSNVMTPLGLPGLAIDTLNHSTSEIHQTFTDLADSSAYPIHFFCQQGKDRTGLTAMLVQMLLFKRARVEKEISLRAIDKDYMLSATELDVEPERTERFKELANMSLPEEFAGCDSGLVGTVDDWLEKQHGGVGRYLESIGIDVGIQDRLRDILLVQEG